MTRGLSRQQLALIAIYAVTLLATLVLALAGQWRLAAAAGIITFGLFSALIVLTLAAMTHAAGGARLRITEMHREVRSARTLKTLNKLDDRYTRLTMLVAESERRREAGELRLQSAFEKQRLQMDDDLAEIRAHLPTLNTRGGSAQ